MRIALVVRRSTSRRNTRQSGALLTHYGSPVVTTHNTVVIPVKTTAAGGYRVEGRTGATGALVWSATTDYVTPPHNWLPPYNVLLTQQGRVYAPDAGGRLLVRDDADAASSTTASHVFYGAAAYNANPAAFDGSVFINTPLTADAQGNVFFGFQVTGANPGRAGRAASRASAPDGTGTWVGAAAAAGDAAIDKPAMNCAPAISNDGATLYIAVNTAAPPASPVRLPARARQHDARDQGQGRAGRPEHGHPRVGQRRRHGVAGGRPRRPRVLRRAGGAVRHRTTRAAGCCSSMRCSIRRARRAASAGTCRRA